MKPYSSFAKASFPITVIATMCAAGCGGGAAAVGVPPTGQISLSIGQAKVSFDGVAKPQIAEGSNAVTVTSMAGASFAGVELIPNPVLANSVISYEAAGTLLLDTNSVESAVPLSAGTYPSDACFTHDGHIILAGYDPISNLFQVFRACYDGTSLTRLTNSTNLLLSSIVSWAPNGTKMAYDGAGGIYTANADGSDETLIVPSGIEPSISPDGTKLAYASGTSSSTVTNIYWVPIGGGKATLVSKGFVYGTGSCYSPSWSPDGKYIAFAVNTGKAQYLEVSHNDGSFTWVIPQSNSATEFDNDPTFSPDGSELAFMRSSTYEGPGSLMICTASGQDPVEVASPNPNGLATPSWSPFFAARPFIGASPVMYTSSAGFLWGQVGDAFASFVTFTATTPSKAAVTLQGSANASSSGPLIYDLHADAITGLKYTNGYYAQINTVIPGPSSSVSDVLITFDPTTGLVTTLAPFTVAKSSGQPLTRTSGGQTICSAKFLGVWNGKGQNLAPAGASTIVVDSKTAKLINFD